MAFTSIDNPELYFQAKNYSGNSTGSTTQAITLDGDENMTPDIVWLKSRSDAEKHWIVDSVRGITNGLNTHLNSAETSSISMVSFDTDGYTVGTDNYSINKSGSNYASWCWKAGGTASSNTDGTNITTSVSAGTTQGISVFTYTGSGTISDTAGHGLGVKPAMVWVKNRSRGPTQQLVWHKNLTSTKNLNMRTTDIELDSTESGWQRGVLGVPTTSVITFTAGFANNENHNNSSDNYVCWCFLERQGFSKFSSFEGTGNVDGTFCWCGFAPSFVMVKKISEAREWMIWDNKRDTFNPAKTVLHADGTSADDASTSYEMIDVLSNGFKLRQSDTDTNQRCGTYIFMAFAEAPFVNSKGVPCQAK